MNQLRLSSCWENRVQQNKYHCELTDDMNSYLLSAITNSITREDLFRFGVYLQYYSPGLYDIRLPGASRGHIRVDENNIITELYFAEDRCFGPVFNCFLPEMKKLKEKYIGYQVMIPEGEKDGGKE